MLESLDGTRKILISLLYCTPYSACMAFVASVASMHLIIWRRSKRRIVYCMTSRKMVMIGKDLRASVAWKTSQIFEKSGPSRLQPAHSGMVVEGSEVRTDRFRRPSWEKALQCAFGPQATSTLSAWCRALQRPCFGVLPSSPVPCRETRGCTTEVNTTDRNTPSGNLGECRHGSAELPCGCGHIRASRLRTRRMTTR